MDLKFIKGFVIIGGMALIIGSTLLIIKMTNKARSSAPPTQSAAPLPTADVAVSLPHQAEVTQIASHAGGIDLLVRLPDGERYVQRLNAAGQPVGRLRFVSQP
ncbi:hypothetical protein [Magnetofaba australis]|uniref:Uncharacterized protein n=1 Tax=Magnetofaba australis IT-1 TaxID=1434232 RepID=A0A1Y2K886_9PROT|nr:hypothetical protein [Magnetofaba australis]OSM04876.1 hypothetical protein MAIT1_02977 [Magnetofaba australis IT-1]